MKAVNYHLSAETVVNIDVLDANDSPPRFIEDNYTVFVQVCPIETILGMIFMVKKP